jgi:UDP-N-acetylmuramoylalanine--D-glutamate ligase
MVAIGELRGRRVGILGYARSGAALAQALRKNGAEVCVFDDGEAARARARDAGFAVGGIEDVPSLALLVPSPGVPLWFPKPHPLVAAARAAGVPVTGDIQLFADSRPDLRLVGITGSNGKSTTSALLHHLLNACGVPALLGGNIGTPVFALDAPCGATVVLELSSFQLDLCDRLRTAVGVWLNLAPDHLDRHGSLEGYIAAKRRLFDQQSPDAHAVIAVDDAISRAVADSLEAQGRRPVRVSGFRADGVAIGVSEGVLVDRLASTPKRFALSGRLRLPGAHNLQNLAAAWAAARVLGCAPEALFEALAGFAGLPHRIEVVAQIDGVLFVNDSKATNPDAAARSLASFDAIHWIAGGRPKPGGFASLLPLIDNVRAGYFIGEAEEELARTFSGRFPVHRCGTLDAALDRAFAAARADAAGAVVLLAPACASFDQFRDFEDRGNRFRERVLALARAFSRAEEQA